MSNLSNYILIPLAAFLMLACASTEPPQEKTSDSIDKPIAAVQKVRPKSPPIKSITKYKTSKEDATGTLLSKEIYNDKGLKTHFIGYDYYGSGEESDKTTYSYNEQGKVIKMVEDNGDRVTTNTYSYDENGNEIASAWARPNGSGASDKTSYNEQGDPVETKYFTAKGVYDFSRVYEYQYNDQGKILVEKKWEKYTDGSADLLQYHISYAYDEDGPVATKSRHRDNGAVSSWEAYLYDAFGNVIEKTEYVGEEIESRETYVYNEYGEVVEDATYSGMDVLNYTNTYQYDKYGHQTSMMYTHEDGENWGERAEYEY